MENELKIDLCLQYCNYTAERLLQAGFVLRYASMKSEACYYEHPARKGFAVRVAIHSFGRTDQRNLPSDFPITMASITFNPKSFKVTPRSWEAIDKIIYHEVGKYFINQTIPERVRRQMAKENKDQ